MFTLPCPAVREYPFLDDWTDKADQWHEEGEVRPVFGTMRQYCLLTSQHDGAHQWPEAVVPAPRRPLRATFIEGYEHN